MNPYEEEIELTTEDVEAMRSCPAKPIRLPRRMPDADETPTVKLFTREELDAAVAAERERIFGHVEPILDWVYIALGQFQYLEMTPNALRAYRVLREIVATRGNTVQPPST